MRLVSGWLLFLLLPLILCGGCGYSAAMAMGAHSNNAEWIRTQQARVTVDGVVQDEEGNPLRGVRVRYRRAYLKAGLDNFPKECEDDGQHTVSGKFHLSWSTAESVHLTFEKDGYAPAELTVAVEATVPKGDYGTMKPLASPVSREDVVIVLGK